jgi:choline dehydrogenase-like flavoprotein
MIFDLENASGAEFPNPDVCIVGAGAAGIVLAVELQRYGKRVLLLDGGGQSVELSAREPYQSEVTGYLHHGVHDGRFRALGGTTTRWGGQILELDDIDFERRPWVDGSGWPFGKSELTPHYKRALELEGLNGAINHDREIWKALGIPPVTEFGEELTGYVSRWCPEPNLSRVHRAHLTANENIGVFLHANAVGVEMKGDGETVSGIRCRTFGQKVVTFRAKSYVLCLGGIETCRFLLQQGVNSRYPWSESRLLGRHFQDHLSVPCGEVENVDAGKFHRYFDNIFYRGYKYHPKFKTTERAQAQHNTLNVAGAFAFLSGADETLNRIKSGFKNIIRGRLGDLSAAEMKAVAGNIPLLARQAHRYLFQHRAYVPRGSRIVLLAHCEQEPLSASNITLSNQRDSIGLLRARLDWRVADREIETARLFAQTVKAAFEELGLASVRLDPELLSGDVRVAGQVEDSNHHMGGARMAESAQAGVVSPQLRIHGTRNFYACSAAVFPCSGFSNPTHTVLALAVRLAGHLSDSSTRGDYQYSSGETLCSR